MYLLPARKGGSQDARQHWCNPRPIRQPHEEQRVTRADVRDPLAENHQRMWNEPRQRLGGDGREAAVS